MLSTESAPGADSSAAEFDGDARRPRRSSGTWLFLGLLGLGAVACLALIAYRKSVQRDSDEYGLVPTGDVAGDAKAFLAAAFGSKCLRQLRMRFLRCRDQVSALFRHGDNEKFVLFHGILDPCKSG